MEKMQVNEGTKMENKIKTKIETEIKYAQVSSSGDYTRISSSGNHAEIISSAKHVKIGSVGDCAKIDATGEEAVIAILNNYDSKFKVGKHGAVSVAYFDGERTRFAVGYVGENLKPDTWYSVNEKGEFVECY